MTISSPAFAPSQNLPPKYSCDGSGVNPPLEFGGVPSAAKSLALIMSDPDAPGGTFYHWLMWNLPVSVQSIAENSAPGGVVQGKNSAGKNGYSAACPPSGTHHYIFTLYALDTMLDLPALSAAPDLQNAMAGHIIGQAELVGLYSR